MERTRNTWILCGVCRRNKLWVVTPVGFGALHFVFKWFSASKFSSFGEETNCIVVGAVGATPGLKENSPAAAAYLQITGHSIHQGPSVQIAR